MNNLICRFGFDTHDKPIYCIDGTVQPFSDSDEQRAAAEIVSSDSHNKFIIKHKDGDKTSLPFIFYEHKDYMIIMGSGELMESSEIKRRHTYYLISKERNLLNLIDILKEYTKSIGIQVEDDDVEALHNYAKKKKLVKTIIITGVICTIAIATVCLARS